MTTQTIQGLLDSMSAEERDIQAIVVAAAVTDTELDDADITDKYNALPDIHKYLIDFVVGQATVPDSPVEHSAMYHSELAHYGVKGMRWGVRNDTSTSRKTAAIDAAAARGHARVIVKSKTGTLGDAHTAALKSTGHRVVNGVLGDKTFWKRTAVTAGAGVGGLVLSGLAPHILPTGMLQDLGTAATGGYGLPSQREAIGGAVAVSIGASLTTIATVGATAVNYGTNAARAIRGNARIRKSHENLGRLLLDRQNEGSKRVQKVLVRNGSLSKRKLRNPRVQHMEEYTLEGTLEHYGVKGMRWGVQKALQANREIKNAQKVVSGKRSSEGYSPRQLKGLKKTAKQRTIGQKVKRHAKQGVVLAIGAAVVKQYLEINGNMAMAEAAEHRSQESYEDAWKRNMEDRDTPMFNPKARLDTSQVEVR